MNVGKLDVDGVLTILDTDVVMTSNKITGLANPTADQDATTKSYVDAIASGLDVKKSVRASTTAALASHTYDNGTAGVGATISADAAGALPAQDGVTLVLNDRLLVKDEGAGTSLENGIYTVTTVGDGSNPFILTRATDADQDAEVTAGMFTFISEGTANSDKGMVLTTDDPITVGTTTLTFSQFSSQGTIVAGDGLTKTVNTLDVVGGDGITANANDITVALDGTSLAKGASGLKLNITGTDNRAVRMNGTGSVQDSLISIADTSGNLTFEVAAGTANVVEKTGLNQAGAADALSVNGQANAGAGAGGAMNINGGASTGGTDGDINIGVTDAGDINIGNAGVGDIVLNSGAALTWPAADGAATDYVMKTDGVGALAFQKNNHVEGFVDADLTAGVLTLNHALVSQYCLVQIYDNNNKQVLPDEITLTDANNSAIDLSSMGTLTGTWHAVAYRGTTVIA